MARSRAPAPCKLFRRYKKYLNIFDDSFLFDVARDLTERGLGDHFDIKARPDRTPRYSGDNAAHLLTDRPIALAVPWCLLVGPIYFPVRPI